MPDIDDNDDIIACLSGNKLYGDDFSEEALVDWFRDEAEAYFSLSSAGGPRRSYGYHGLNIFHGFSNLPEREFSHLLGLGSAWGDELTPVLDRVDRITIVDPARGFNDAQLLNKPIRRVDPDPRGCLPFEDSEFDLITCFGVLHHVANVTSVVAEISRCLKPDGFALIREPTVSMGDWRYPRSGLTKRERGIPLKLFQQIIHRTGLRIIREQRCMFSLTMRLGRRIVRDKSVYNSRKAVLFDRILCSLPLWPNRYHATKIWHKFRPTCVFYVLSKA